MAAGRVNLRTDNFIDTAVYRERSVYGHSSEWGAENVYRRPKSYSNTTQRKRARSKSLSRGFVAFLTFMSIASVVVCIQFLRLKSEFTTVQDNNEVMMSQLTSLRAENDARYASIDNSIDLAEVKERAINEFDMNYAAQNQIIWYNADNSGYIRQYGEIPD